MEALVKSSSSYVVKKWALYLLLDGESFLNWIVTCDEVESKICQNLSASDFYVFWIFEKSIWRMSFQQEALCSSTTEDRRLVADICI